jgi:redox-sensitive bicupin YhaK (pirin superfamily)
MNEGADFEFELPANYNTGILVIEGTVVVNQTSKAEADNFILFKNDGESIHLSATENAKLLVLNGEAINEPIVPYGPFLMNTKEEIMQAYNDFNTGKFGVLED